LKEYRNDFRKCDLGKVLGSLDFAFKEALGSCVNHTRLGIIKLSMTYLLGIEVIALKVSFLLGNGRPKFDRLQRDRLIF
jgi:hypothetical protein